MKSCASFVLCMSLVGCAGGLGPSTAATRPLLGQTTSSKYAMMWVASDDQSNVPAGMVRVEQKADGFARLFHWISITSAVRKGSATPEIAGVAGESKEVIELDLALTGRIPLPIGGLSFGAGRLWSLEDNADLSGFGVRASVAPIAQFSVDFAHSWVGGTLEESSGTMDLSGTRTSLGATLLIWGLNQFRFGVAVAKAWTDAGTYTSDGYTYQLVSTMW